MARGFTSHDLPPDVPVVLGAGAEPKPEPKPARSRPAKSDEPDE